MAHPTAKSEDQGASPGVGRRRFLTFLVAAPVLTVGAKVGMDMMSSGAAEAAPKVPQPADKLDLGRQLQLAAMPTENNVLLEVGEDGIVRLFLHRMEVGQGITTAIAMLVADEMDLPLSRVQVPLRQADPDLLFNQLTGGSATLRHLYGPVRQAAAGARGRLMETAAQQWGADQRSVTTRDGMVVAPDGRTADYGSLTAAAATLSSTSLMAEPKPESAQKLVGQPTRRIDGRDIVTGKQKYTLDHDVPGAKPTMVRRPPTIKGKPKTVHNEDAVRQMPGVSDVVVIPTGVAVVADTFGQAWDGVQALEVSWLNGPSANRSDEDVERELRENALPLTTPDVLGDSLDFEFYWHFVSHAPMEVNSAIADVRSDRAEIWSGLKIPIIALQDIAKAVGLSDDQVQVNVVQAGGSFGRRLFHDAALEAAQVSKAVGHPVKLMWHRFDDIRHGRMRPAALTQARVTMLADDVVAYQHLMSGQEASAEHGLGEHLTAAGARASNVGFSQAIFHGVIHCPYNFGLATALLNEKELGFNTGSWRSPYSSVVRPGEEIIIDELAAKLGKDPYEFRREFLIDDRNKAVLDAVAEEGNWGRQMPAGHAQGIAMHEEYNSHTAWLVEIDATDPKNPRVTKAVGAADVGHPINPSGIEQMMLGGLNDGISYILQAGLHIENGLPLEASYADYHWARQRHYPQDVKIIVMPSNTTDLGGAGELGVAGAAGAVANAYARATGTKPRRFPINFDVDFEPVPR